MNATKLSEQAKTLALTIWQEQLDAGIGEPGEMVDPERLDEWLFSRTYHDPDVLNAAAAGDVRQLAYVRDEAGLPILG